MISDSIKALMVKRGASSMMGRAPEEYGPEETSRVRLEKPLEVPIPVQSVGDKVDEADADADGLLVGDRKRLRRDGESVSRLRIKRAREVVPRPLVDSHSGASKAKGKGAELVDDENIDLEGVVRAVRLSYGQVFVFPFSLLCFLSFFFCLLFCILLWNRVYDVFVAFLSGIELVMNLLFLLVFPVYF